MNLNFVLSTHKAFCIEFTCCSELQTDLGISCCNESDIKDNGDVTMSQYSSICSCVNFKTHRRFFTAPSAHSLELFSAEKNIFLFDKNKAGDLQSFV
jgi:hypothetical protein